MARCCSELREDSGVVLIEGILVLGLLILFSSFILTIGRKLRHSLLHQQIHNELVLSAKYYKFSKPDSSINLNPTYAQILSCIKSQDKDCAHIVIHWRSHRLAESTKMSGDYKTDTLSSVTSAPLGLDVTITLSSIDEATRLANLINQATLTVR
jgi:hypothetical protein